MKNASKEKELLKSLYKKEREKSPLSLTPMQIEISNKIKQINHLQKKTQELFLNNNLTSHNDITEYLLTLPKKNLLSLKQTCLIKSKSNSQKNIIKEILNSLYV